MTSEIFWHHEEQKSFPLGHLESQLAGPSDALESVVCLKNLISAGGRSLGDLKGEPENVEEAVLGLDGRRRGTKITAVKNHKEMRSNRSTIVPLKEEKPC